MCYRFSSETIATKDTAPHGKKISKILVCTASCSTIYLTLTYLHTLGTTDSGGMMCFDENDDIDSQAKCKEFCLSCAEKVNAKLGGQLGAYQHRGDDSQGCRCYSPEQVHLYRDLV